MDNLMLILFLVCLAFLVAGLIKPSLFKAIFKDNTSRGKIAMVFGGLSVLFFIFFGIASDQAPNTAEALKPASATTDMVKPEKHNPQASKNKVTKPGELDYSVFDYKLPESNYYYKVKIMEVIIKPAKDAFETRADQYSSTTSMDGYYLNVKYTVTNPYEREMLFPVPQYYYITSYNKEPFSTSTTFHRDCECDIDNTTEVVTDKGKNIWKISEGKCGNSDPCVRFRSREAKTFIIKFTDPIFGNVQKLAFWGFDFEWNNPSYTRPKDRALVIDIRKKQITGEIKF